MNRNKIFLVLVVLSITALSCQAATGLLPFSASPTPAASPSPLPSLSPTVTPAPTRAAPSSTPQAAPGTVAPQGYQVLLHPDGGLFVGDLVSLEIISPQGVNLESSQARVLVDAPQGPSLEPAKFGRSGLAQRMQATLLWAWDTAQEAAGEHTLTISIEPDGPIWTQTVILQPKEDLPPPEPEAHWAQVETQCCVVHYITGTDAARDIDILIPMIDEQAKIASQKIGADVQDPIPIVLLPRVLGHGGFTKEEISVSYLDRNYAGGITAMVLRHEMVHWYDSRLGGDLRPSLFVEGLAVYLSGGHFKPEPLAPRAAALLNLGWYIPLHNLADDFYLEQHEISYMEAGALIGYMVDTWGWDAFNAFYRDIHPVQGGSQAEAINEALHAHFSLTFSALEERFLTYLHAQAVTQDLIDDVRQSVNFYNLVRRYQQEFDPSAYFLTAWLPDGVVMRQRGIVADYVRHPQGPENLVLEGLLVEADKALREGDYVRVGELLGILTNALNVRHPSPEKPITQWPLSPAG